MSTLPPHSFGSFHPSGYKSNIPPQKKARILTFVSQKGGTGKTTIAQNLAVCFAQNHAKRVLGVDLDPQGCFSEGLQLESIYTKKTSDSLLLVPQANAIEYVIPVRPNFDLIPNNFQKEIRDAVERMSLTPDLLRRRLSSLISKYDYIFLDTPAGLTRSTQFALDAADEIIIVLSCSKYALKGASAILDWIDSNDSVYKPKPEIKVILNNYDERRRFDRQFKKDVEYIFGSDLYETHIHNSVKVVEAASNGVSIVEVSESHVCATDFRSLSREILSSHSNHGLSVNNSNSIPSTNIQTTSIALELAT